MIVSPEEYLRREAEAFEKSEYRAGFIFPLPAAGANHITILSNLHMVAAPPARRRGCRFLGSNAKIQIAETDAYYYADGSIGCPIRWTDRENGVYENPSVIFEIVSPAYENKRGVAKFRDYMTLDSLREYVLIDSQSVAVQVYRRKAPDEWSVMMHSQLDRAARVETIEADLPLADLYDGVEF